MISIPTPTNLTKKLHPEEYHGTFEAVNVVSRVFVGGGFNSEPGCYGTFLLESFQKGVD